MGGNMQYIINSEKNLSAVAIGGWFVRGSFNDFAGREGEHHFLEHILFNIPYIKNYSNALKDKGLTTNAFTSQELMCFYVVCLEDSFTLAYNCIRYLLERPVDLTEYVDFKNERSIIKREIEYHFNYIEEMKKQLLIQMFGKKSANFNIMGSLESVDNIHQSDVINVYESLFNGNKFITIAGNNLHTNNFISDGAVARENRFNNIIVSGSDKYIDESDGCDYCYYGISFFYNKKQRYTGQVYTEFLREILFTKLREQKGLTYRINTANMNLSSGLIAFLIFKIRGSDIPSVQETIMECVGKKFETSSLVKCEQRLRVKNILNSDNVTSEMLSLGYSNTILQGEESELLNWEVFFRYLDEGGGDYYQRIIGIRTGI